MRITIFLKILISFFAVSLALSGVAFYFLFVGRQALGDSFPPVLDASQRALVDSLHNYVGLLTLAYCLLAVIFVIVFLLALRILSYNFV